MAKRFYDSRKFQDPWYRKLDPRYKLFWDYLLCTCNHAGIWKIDFELAEFCIGLEIDVEEILVIFEKRIIVINEEKWFIPKFVLFQYGELNEKVNCHKSVIFELKRERVYQQFINSCLTVKDKDKDKDLDKDNILSIENEFKSLWAKYPKKLGMKMALKHYKASRKNGKTYEQVLRAIDNYIALIEKDKTENQYIKHGSTFFNNWGDYEQMNVQAPKRDLKDFTGVGQRKARERREEAERKANEGDKPASDGNEDLRERF